MLRPVRLARYGSHEAYKFGMMHRRRTQRDRIDRTED
jgi:hypothetical protein